MRCVQADAPRERVLSTALRMAVLCICLGTSLTGAQPALAQAPWWRLNATSAHSHLPSEGEAQFVVTATNVGDAPVNGSPTPVTIRYELPEGVTPLGSPEANAGRGVPGQEGSIPLSGCEVIHLANGRSAVSCKFTEILTPFDHLLMRITTKVEHPTGTPLDGVLTVTGGNATAAELVKPLDLQEEPKLFGVETYELTPEGEGGSRDSQAGSHPFQLTTTLDLNQTLASYSALNEKGIYPSSPALPRSLHFRLPPGLVGDVSAAPQCSKVDFTTALQEDTVNLCPPDTAIGVVTLVANDPVPAGFQGWSVPVFNLTPEEGEPARFGFLIEGVPVVVRTSVPTGGEYGVEASVGEISQAVQVLSTQLTLWGVPGDPRHDSARGYECLGGGAWYGAAPHPPCPTTSEKTPTAFLTLPTSCERPPETTVEGQSWPIGEARTVRALEGQTSYAFPSALENCDLLSFQPTISVEPDEHSASTPTGLTVGVHVPQQGLLSASGRAESAVRETTVRLPEGLLISPAAANGLEACSASAFGSPFLGADEDLQTGNTSFRPGFPGCPDAAKVGTVEVSTPLLPDPLTGAVYLAQEHTAPFQAPLVIYLVAEDHAAGILVKLAGTITPEPGTGQLVSTFENTPQLPFEDLKLHFFGGPRASVSTPPRCGSYPTQALFTPWSGGPAASAPPVSFAISSGAGGSPCPSSQLPFAPSMRAGATNSQAGAFSDFELEIAHSDGDQQLTGVTVHLPPGLAAMLKSVTPCAEPQASLGQCGPESEIGHVSASAGLGPEPFVQTGHVYLTGPYQGSPFGLSIVTPAVAGPFNLGEVVVRSAISVDPHTAAVTVSSSLPTTVQGVGLPPSGVPLQLKQIQVSIDRQDFQFNPTNCSPTSITGTLGGGEGAAAPVVARFTATGCASLPFTPTLTASTQGQASRSDGASLTVRVTATPGQANVARTVLTLPKTLPSRQSTIRQACLAAVFESNPATCPEGSVIGSATVHTPVLKSPLTGPGYLVSHGGAAFPDVEFVLQGEGIKLILDGQTNISNGVTTSSFNSVPDAPIESFEAVLPEGPHSALGLYLPGNETYNLCGTALAMPTTIAGQNGAVIKQSTKIAITGCKAVAGFKAKKLTRAQKLKKALIACRKRFKHSRQRRVSCENKARRAYRPKQVAHRSHHKP